jgi:hypothetical protein
VCVENDGYAHAPELNDVLHLHRKGIAEIENLEPYVGLKTIYLESNSVDTLEGLLHLSLLRCLYMAKNALMDVEGAVRLKALVTLDISENHVDSLEGLRGHQTLATLVAAGNRLADVDAVDALRDCPRLTSLDLSDNKLRDVSVVAFLTSKDAGLANRLALLKFRGNPAVGETKSYRKTVVARMRALNYLDDAPVFPKDRRLAEAWARGGVEEERAERGRIFDDEKKHRERQARNFDAMVAEAKRDAAARASSGEPETKPTPYRFMSESAAAEARLMLEEDVPEWRIEEMRAQETFPWQVQARREEEARAAAEEEARAAAEEEAEARARAERDAEKARVVEALSASITDETLTQMVAEQVRDSLRLSRASVPVAIPVADDGPTPGIHVAAVAEEDETTSSGTKAQENAFPDSADSADSGFDALAAELARRADPGAYAAARAATRRRELERHAEATSAAGAGAGGWAPGAPRRADVSKGRSPVVYGTKSFDALWAQAKALGETLEAEEAEASRVRSGVGSRSPSTLASERRDEDEDDDDETERSDGSDAGGSFDSDADPYERHSVVTVAGARREETLFALD